MTEKKWSPLVIFGSLILILGIICFLLASKKWTQGAGAFSVQMEFLIYSGIYSVVGLMMLSIGILLWRKYKRPALKLSYTILFSAVILFVLGLPVLLKLIEAIELFN